MYWCEYFEEPAEWKNSPSNLKLYFILILSNWKKLTCGIPEYCFHQSREALLGPLERMYCMIQKWNWKPNRFVAQVYSRQFCWPKKKWAQNDFWIRNAYLTIVIGSTKIPKFILQGCPTSILSFCTITIFEGQVFVNITSNEMNISEKTLFNLPLKSTMKGLLENLVHDTRTAFPVGKVVVGGTVAVVTSGADVVSIHSNSLQGQPAEQFSWICN